MMGSNPGYLFKSFLLYIWPSTNLTRYSLEEITSNYYYFQTIIQPFPKIHLVQLNKYETDPYFHQIFQSNTSVCLIISVFCKSCEPICEPEIILKTFAADFQANTTDISCKNTFTFSVQFTSLTIRRNKHCRALEF
jgi:hypothetical protein